MSLTKEELEKRKKTNKTILKWTFILLLLSFVAFVIVKSNRNDKGGYHHRKGYIDRNGNYHKGGTVKNPINK